MKIFTLSLALIALPLFILAADVTGTWKSEFDSQIGLQKCTFMLKQDGSPSDTNLIHDRDKLVPHAAQVNGLSADFTRQFPAYSFTVLKLRTKCFSLYHFTQLIFR